MTAIDQRNLSALLDDAQRQLDMIDQLPQWAQDAAGIDGIRATKRRLESMIEVDDESTNSDTAGRHKLS